MRRWNLNYLLIFIPFALWLYYFTKAEPASRLCHGRDHDRPTFEDRR